MEKLSDPYLELKEIGETWKSQAKVHQSMVWVAQRVWGGFSSSKVYDT